MKKVVIFIVLASVLLLVASCYPGLSMSEAPESLKEFLAFLATSVGIGAAISFVYEKFPYIDEWFAAQDSRAKRLIIFVSCFAVPAAALGAMVGLGYTEFSPDLVYGGARAGFEAFGASQLAHMAAMKKAS